MPGAFVCENASHDKVGVEVYLSSNCRMKAKKQSERYQKLAVFHAYIQPTAGDQPSELLQKVKVYQQAYIIRFLIHETNP